MTRSMLLGGVQARVREVGDCLCEFVGSLTPERVPLKCAQKAAVNPSGALSWCEAGLGKYRENPISN